MGKREPRRFVDMVLALAFLGRVIIIALTVWAFGWWAIPWALLLIAYDAFAGPVEDSAADWRERLSKDDTRA